MQTSAMKVYFLIAECSLPYAKLSLRARMKEGQYSTAQSFLFYYDYSVISYSQSYFSLILCYTFTIPYSILDFFP